MPVYEYRCPKCGMDFEILRRISQMDELALCPTCGTESERLVSAFASKVGFYIRAPTKPALRRPSEESDNGSLKREDKNS
jgi:putative FmdB family regulatory protein